jgi:hypothetical protein
VVLCRQEAQTASHTLHTAVERMQSKLAAEEARLERLHVDANHLANKEASDVHTVRACG